MMLITLVMVKNRWNRTQGTLGVQENNTRTDTF